MVVSLAFVLAPTPVHADLVTYTMTATVTDVNAWSLTRVLNPSSAPVAVGDRIAWTFQYDRATPLIQSTHGVDTTASTYSLAGPLVTHLVDQTKGIALYTAPPGSISAGHTLPQLSDKPYSSLRLTAGLAGAGFLFQDVPPGTPTPYSASVWLSSSQALPTMNLAHLQLDRLPIAMNGPLASQFSYRGKIPGVDGFFDFGARLNSLSPSASVQPVPEPGTFSLFALGTAGLVVLRFPRAFGRVG